MASGEQARALDLAAAGLGVSNDALMALASFQCARLARRLLCEQGQERPRPLAVLAGRGNNGADALGCARHLAAWGHPVRAATLADPTHRGDVYSNQLRAALASGVEVREATDDLGAAIRWTLEGAALAVDGLLGTGTTGPARGAVAAAIAAVNLGGVRVMAIDVPSGLDATTGERPGECLRAADTLMLAIAKSGCLAAQASAWVGRPWLADIGVPAGAYAAVGLRRPWLEAGDLVPLDSGRGPAG
jgi:NAD(P)H-hydrate epimerase